jgi:heme/copper-type cytochrome/quinol oxidase subunit 1
MLFALAFVVQFAIGGVAGVMFAAFPMDWQMEDTYFVVAHLHYVLMGGTAFALWAGIYYWFPKMSGRMLDERLGKLHFWLAFIGFNVAFMPQHLLGFIGMARRIYTYPDLPYFHLLNLVSTIGAAILGLAVIVFLWNLIVSACDGASCPPRVGHTPQGVAQHQDTITTAWRHRDRQHGPGEDRGPESHH